MLQNENKMEINKNKKGCHNSKVNLKVSIFSYIDVLHTISSASHHVDSKWYFADCIWAFVCIPTRNSSAAEFTAKKKLERR